MLGVRLGVRGVGNQTLIRLLMKSRAAIFTSSSLFPFHRQAGGKLQANLRTNEASTMRAHQKL